jgi:hypothetical protein
MASIPIPEEIAAATVEACAQWLDRLARESPDEGEQEQLGDLAEALRGDMTAIVAQVTNPTGAANS